MHSFLVRRGGGLVALSLALQACGGGGGSGSGVVAIPPPPPPPPAAPSYATFPSNVANTEYDVLSFGMGGTFTTEEAADGSVRITGLSPHDVATGPGTNDYRITQVSPGVYFLDIHGFGGPTFEMQDGDARFLRDSEGDTFETHVFELAKPDVAIDLTYTGFGNFTWMNTDTKQGYMGFLAIGEMTRPDDAPVTGTASYTGIADGLWFDGTDLRRLYGSTASLLIDFGTGSVTSSLSLVGRLDPFGDFMAAPAATLGTFNGTGTLSSSRIFYSGDYAPAAGYSGGFGGAVFGPSAAEFGLNFSLTGPGSARVAGVAVGKKN